MNKIDYINKKIKIRNITLAVQWLDIFSSLSIIYINMFSSLSLFLIWLTFQVLAKAYAYSGIKKMTNISREFELKFGEELKRDVKDLKKQLQEELLKQKANEIHTNEEDKNNEEFHVYKVSNDNVIDMELSNVYIPEKNNKTLKKVKERRY